MFTTIRNAWKIPELRKKLLFTALIILIFRIGCAIPIPFISIGEEGLLNQAATTATFLDYVNMISGNAFNYGTIFALSITPYINASIIIELLTVAIPVLERLAKEGEEGRKKIATITRYVTIALAILQGVAYFVYLRSQNEIIDTCPFEEPPKPEVEVVHTGKRSVKATRGSTEMTFASCGKAAEWIAKNLLKRGITVREKQNISNKISLAIERQKPYSGYTWSKPAPEENT